LLIDCLGQWDRCDRYFIGWLVETWILMFSSLGQRFFGCLCGERDELYDEHEAAIACFMRSIAGRLVNVKRLNQAAKPGTRKRPDGARSLLN
jgi:hypothetical protein